MTSSPTLMQRVLGIPLAPGVLPPSPEDVETILGVGDDDGLRANGVTLDDAIEIVREVWAFDGGGTLTEAASKVHAQRGAAHKSFVFAAISESDMHIVTDAASPEPSNTAPRRPRGTSEHGRMA